MSDPPETEPEQSNYARLPLPVVAIGLFVPLAVHLALGLSPNANLRPRGVVLATPAPPVAAATPAPATIAPTAAPTRVPSPVPATETTTPSAATPIHVSAAAVVAV